MISTSLVKIKIKKLYLTSRFETDNISSVELLLRHTNNGYPPTILYLHGTTLLLRASATELPVPFLSHLLIARCDIGVQLSVRLSVRSFIRPFVRLSIRNLCQGAYSVVVIAGSMKPCIVITLDTLFKKAP